MADMKNTELNNETHNNNEEYMDKLIHKLSLSDVELSQISGGYFDGDRHIPNPLPKLKVGDPFKLRVDDTITGRIMRVCYYGGPSLGYIYEVVCHRKGKLVPRLDILAECDIRGKRSERRPRS